jgi:hypothetical protein
MAVSKSRHAASRIRIGANGSQDPGGEFSGYSRHCENGKGCDGPNESMATTRPKPTERRAVMMAPKANLKSNTANPKPLRYFL